MNDGMEVLFQFYLWDKSHITIVWNTRETGDMNAPYLLLLEDDSSKVFDQSLAEDLLFTCTLVCFITSNSFSHKLVPDGLRSNPPNPPELPSKPPEFFSKPPEFFSKRFASPLPFPLLRQSESFLQRGSIKIVEKLFRNFKHWLFLCWPSSGEYHFWPHLWSIF